MKIFVTGGAGYIGSAFVQQVLNAGHDVTVFDNLTEGHRSAVDERAGFVQGDLKHEAEVQAAVGEAQPEVIVHFAAHALVGESMVNPGKYFGNNVANGIHLLNAAVSAGVRKFIFSSTCAVYGLPERVPITEDTPLRPINPYGESKRMMELMLQWYHKVHGLDYAALRYFNAAGATDKFGEHHRVETHLIPNVLRVAQGKSKQCEIYGTDYPTPDGTCIRDYIHVLDLAQAHMQAMTKGRVGAYNLGSGHGYSVRQVIDACEKVTGERIKAAEQPPRPGDPPRLVASSKKAQDELGWQPEYVELERIVQTAWDWHQRHPEGYSD